MNKDSKMRFVPLTTAQAAYLARPPVNPHHRNIARMLEVPATLDITLLQRAMRYVQMQHETLGLRFVHDAERWHQYLTRAYEEIPFTYIDLSTCPASEQGQAIEKALPGLQASLNLFEGPVWRVAYFNRGSSRSGRLLLIVNHMVADGFSFPIVLADLQTVYQQLRDGQPVRLPPVPTSFSSCARQQMEYAQAKSFKQDLDYWLAQAWAHTARLPLDFPSASNANNMACEQEVSTSLSREETQTLLRDVCSIYKTHILEMLLLALTRAFTPWIGARALHISVILSGRNTYEIFAQTPLAHLDLTYTIGYLSYSTDYLVLDPGQSGTLEGELQAIQAQFRHMPHQGFSSPGLHYLCQDDAVAQTIHSLPVYELCLNYLGSRDRRGTLATPLFSSVQETAGMSQDPRNPRRSLVICQAAIIDHQLMVALGYNRYLHRRETMEALIQSCSETLRALIGMCASNAAKRRQPEI